MRGNTIFKLANKPIKKISELYDPTYLPDYITIDSTQYTIGHITDEICSQTERNDAKSFWLCRTIHVKLQA